MSARATAHGQSQNERFVEAEGDGAGDTSVLDPAAILAALAVDDVRRISSAGEGLATALWRVDSGRGSYALRVFQPDQQPVYHREQIAMRAAAAAGLPVPRVHAARIWRQRPVLLLSWCPGDPLLRAVEQRPWRIWQLATAFGRMQATLNAVPAPPELDPHPVSWIDWLGDGEERLQERLRSCTPVCPMLLHLDYHPLNVLAHGGRVSAVLDWTNVRVGDPRIDFARTYAYLHAVPTPDDTPRWAAMARRLFAQGWRHGYEQVAGPLDDLAIFFAWAGALAARDLAPKIGQPGSWLRPHHIESLREWTAVWKRRAGI